MFHEMKLIVLRKSVKTKLKNIEKLVELQRCELRLNRPLTQDEKDDLDTEYETLSVPRIWLKKPNENY